MRLYNYLNEAIAHETLYRDSLKAQSLISKCKNNIKHITIFRGDKDFIRSDGDDEKLFYFPAGSRAERKSKNTNNHYTLLMSGLLDCWKQYPPRNKSMICSADMNKARKYTAGNNVLVIIPFDNTPIGVCPERDIWDSFPMLAEIGIDSVADVNEILDECGISENKIASELSMNFQTFVDNVLSIRNGLISAYTRTEFEDYKLGSKFSTLKAWLEYMLDPRRNSFSITSDPSSLARVASEVWFSGSAIGYFAQDGFKLS